MNTPNELDAFRRFSIFNTLEAPLFISLCQQLTIKTAKNKSVLFNYQDFDTQDYFLVKGKVELIDKLGNKKTIEAGMPNSNHPLSAARPRENTAKASSDIEYFTLDSAVLKQITERNKRTSDNLALFLSHEAKSSQDALFHQFEHELNRGYFVLPSFPETALKIRQKVEQINCDINELVNLIQSDPSLSAKLVKTANSPLYRGVSDCKDITAAVMRLGLSTTQQMAMSFAVLSLFESDSKFLKQQMEITRKKCIRVACLAFILSANAPLLNQEEALLAGLLYPIGKIIIIAYADHIYQLDENPSQLALIVASLKKHAGKISTEQWGFPQHLIEIATEYDPQTEQSDNSEFNYNDLITCCKSLSLVDLDHLENLPSNQHSSSWKKLYTLFGNRENFIEYLHKNIGRLNELQQLFII